MTSTPDLKLVGSDPDRVACALAERTDDELMVAAGAGSRDAFAVLVQRYISRLVNYCAKVAGTNSVSDSRVGEELAQDVLLQVWAHRSEYKPSQRFRVFLFTIARNRCRNHNRAWRRRLRWQIDDASQVDIAAASGGDADHLDDLLDRERQRHVREALRRLPEKLREVLLLRFEQGLDYGDIALMVRRPEATVRSRAFHGLRKLREFLKGERA